MKNVQDIYPLSPLQEGMLFHTVAEAGTGVYVDQVSAKLAGDLEPPQFEAAWRRLVQRHPALRTAFLWDGVDEPLQVVREQVHVPWSHEDWRSLGAEERDRRREDRLREERVCGFDPSAAPLMRMTLARTGEREWWWLWTFHHLLADGWSTAILLRELFAEYAGSARTPADDRTYRDYIAWHAQRDLGAAERFWREELRGFGAPTRLPRLAPAPADGAGLRPRELELSEEATRKIRSFASDHALTLNTVVQGAWGLLLGRLAREDDVVCGITTSGRPPDLPGIETAIGLFINTLPLRMRPDPDAGLVPWLRDLQRRQLALREFEFTPLAAVQRWSELPAGEPLFESILVFENYPAAEALVPDGLAVDVCDLRFDEQSNYPLALLCLPTEQLRFIAVHDPSLFDDEDISRILTLLARLLEGFAVAPDTRLRDLRLDDDDDRRALAAWNDTDVAAGRTGCIHEWFEETAARHPDALAVAAPEAELTYADLERRSGALARTLRGHGVGPDVPVAILAEPSAEMIIGILGTLRAGGAYLPIDPSYPASHVRHVLADTKAPVLVTSPSGRDRVPDTGARVVTIGDSPGTPAPDAESGSPADGSSLAYILYTSGTSGRPKGVEVTHANLAHSTEARTHVYGERVGSFLLLSSFAFDSSIAGIFWTLVSGGTLVIPRPGLEQDLRELLALVRRREVTHTLCLPTLWSLILNEATADDLATLRTVIVAGEACGASVVRDHHRGPDRARLFNEYGPTEATVWSTVHELTPEDAADPVSIGRPIPRMRAYVLDEQRRPLPAGAPGELWLAGAGIARGYRNLRELTDECFVPLANLGESERAYRTGDLAAWRPDGTLRFLGRADAQVKLRGHRIEPAGIEAVLREHAGVEDAAVAVRGTLLVAYLVATEGPSESSLREHLRQRLPAFLVPDAFVRRPALPRTASGKLDHRKLPDPASPIPDDGAESGAPRNAIEATLAEIWCEVLQRSSVGIHDDYFSLGGDSILSIRIVSRVRAAGLRVDPRHVLERPTIAELARTVRGAPDAAPADGPVVGEVSLAPIQAWFLARDLAAPHHWNQSALLETPSDLDPDRLRAALTALLSHHDQLRARFECDADGRWRQIVAAPDEVEAPLSVEPFHAATFERRAAEAQGCLHLARAPLLRAVLFRGEDSSPGRLLLAVHHLVVDAVSWNILLEDLEEAYAQATGDDPPRLPTRTASYRSWVGSLPPDAPAEPWLRLLSADASDPPVDAEVGDPPSEAAAGTVHRELPPELTEAVLTSANDAYRTRAEELLLAALTLAVGGAPERTSLRLFREGHGRDGDLDVSRTVGWFTSVVPVVVHLERPSDCGSVIRDTKETLRAIPEPSQAYGRLRWGSSEATASRLEAAGEPQVLFNYLGRAPEPRYEAVFRPIDGATTTARDPANARSHPLEINAIVREGRLGVDWIFAEPVHRRETVETWADRFVAELARLVEHCRGEGTGSFTASDFPESGLDEDDLGKLMERLP